MPLANSPAGFTLMAYGKEKEIQKPDDRQEHNRPDRQRHPR